MGDYQGKVKRAERRMGNCNTRYASSALHFGKSLRCFPLAYFEEVKHLSHRFSTHGGIQSSLLIVINYAYDDVIIIKTAKAIH